MLLDIPRMIGPFLFVGFLILVFGMVLFLGSQERKKWDSCLKKLANQLGLTFVPGGPSLPNVSLLSFLRNRSRIEGYFRCRWCGLDSITKGSGKSKRVLTNLHVSTNGATPELILGRKSLAALLSAKLNFVSGVKIAKTGDAELDHFFLVRSRNASLAKIVLTTPEIRSALLDTWKRHKVRGKLFNTPELFVYEEGAALMKADKTERLVALADLLATLADAFDAATDAG